MLCYCPTVRPGRLGSGVLTLVALSHLGCAATTPVRAPSVLEIPLPETDPPPYKVQVGDRLEIKFWGNPELDQEVIVRPDGMISLPFVDEIRASDRTPLDLDAELTTKYAVELTRPEITVMVREISGLVVYVGGAVRRQGAIPLAGRMTLVQALQQAGMEETARRRQVLLIREGTGGDRIARSLDIRPALSGEDPNLDIELQASDIIFVPSVKAESLRLFMERYVQGLLPVRIVGTIDIFDPFDSGDGGGEAQDDGQGDPQDGGGDP